MQGATIQNKESTFINIPLLYDPNVPIDPEIWNGGFYPISLHSLIKHIASDAKNIKDSLKFMAKYILNKQVEPTKTNDLDNFNGIGNAVWNFISSIYDTNWDALFTDNKSTTLRKKITAKFTPRIQPILQRNLKKINKPSLASIERIPLSILAKSQKEINIISKLFKNKKSETPASSKTKSYVQVSK